MIHKKISNVQEFLAGDHTHLKEVLHPSNDNLELGYSLAHAYIKVGEQSLPHRLHFSETYYFLEGKGEIYVNDKMIEVKPNEIVFVPPHALQYVKNTGQTPLNFICIVSPPWSAETEEIKEKQEISSQNLKKEK